jgi:hypothetical protein
MRRQSLALLATVIGTVSLSAGDSAAAESARVSATFNANGSGEMIANSQTNPETETWSWEVCRVDLSDCRPFGTGRSVSTRRVQTRSIFRATSNLGATALSPVWKGKVVSLAPPTVDGVARANKRVIPVPGLWRGGWAGSSDLTQLSACKGAAGIHCTTLTDIHYRWPCPKGAAVLDPVFTGQYLRVADTRIGPDFAIFDYAVSSPYESEVWRVQPTISVRMLGRIKRATGAREAKCGPPPLTEAPERRPAR